MKKVVAVLAVITLSIGFVGCNPEDTTSEEQLLLSLDEQASDKDEEPDDEDPDA